MKYLQIYEERIGCSIVELTKHIAGLASKVVNNSICSFRVKDESSLKKKLLLKKTKDIFLLKDVYGIRILVDEVEDVHKVLNFLSGKISGYVKNDYIVSPKTRDEVINLKGKKIRFIQYIATKNGVFYEIQITTKEFHRLNEELHEGYKKYKYGL